MDARKLFFDLSRYKITGHKSPEFADFMVRSTGSCLSQYKTKRATAMLTGLSLEAAVNSVIS